MPPRFLETYAVLSISQILGILDAISSDNCKENMYSSHYSYSLIFVNFASVFKILLSFPILVGVHSFSLHATQTTRLCVLIAQTGV